MVKARVKLPFKFMVAEALNAFERMDDEVFAKLKGSSEIVPKWEVSTEWRKKLVDILETSSP
ncbi:hypothetical protein ACLOJK_008587 [Asimina triloba]